MALVKDPEIKNCKGVYEPREDSYLLSKCVTDLAFGKVLDIGTGTGIQGIVAAMKGCEVTFADIDENALSCAKSNAKENEVEGKFVQSDIFSNVSEKFNTIIFNPPYLESSEVKHMDLDGGRKGRELIDRFLADYKRHVLDEHMVLLLESSINDYEKDVKKLRAEVVGKAHYFFEDLVVLRFG